MKLDNLFLVFRVQRFVGSCNTPIPCLCAQCILLRIRIYCQTDQKGVFQFAQSTSTDERKNPKQDKKSGDKKGFFSNRRCQEHVCVCANSPVSNQNSNSIRFYCNQIGICVKVKWHSNSLWQTPECAKLHLNQPRKKKHKRPMSIHHTQTYIFISVSIYQSNNSVAFYLVHLVGIFCGWFCPSSLRFSIAAWWSFKQISG